MKLAVSFVLALAILVICSTSVFAEPLFSMSVVPGAAPSTWVYTLTNNDTTGDAVLMWLDIFWEPAQPTSYYTTTGSPATWVINNDWDWPSWDNFIGNTPGPGQSLTGFEITAPTYAPNYQVTYNLLGDERWETGVVPEPSSMLVLLGGVGTLGAMIRRRRA